jgi:phage gpG-like protein
MLTFNPELSPDPNHAHVLAAVCVNGRALARGVSVRERLTNGAWSAVGLVPSNVAYVTLHSADGQTQTTPVANNSYRTTVPNREVSVSFERQGVEY